MKPGMKTAMAALVLATSLGNDYENQMPSREQARAARLEQYRNHKADPDKKVRRKQTQASRRRNRRK